MVQEVQVEKLKRKGASSLLTDTQTRSVYAPHRTGRFSRRGLFSHPSIFTRRCLVQVAMQRQSVALMDECIKDEWHVSLIGFYFLENRVPG